ncbi:tyrosine-type recombinase/integrase [Edaphobacter acidisoli]|uniref:tyrosine-type recombinase/integrase n=1 Tax=Edaphobacter acidisoli TaxID=2040573 RepID=UPI00166E1655|nr:tyrosine-type recombinase/integrase [Edaphobacter acidisoli]
MAIETIFAFESTRRRQRVAPLLEEREQFLSYMLHQGTSIRRMRSVAAMLINVIRLMQLEALRDVEIEEVQEAALRWIVDLESKNRNGQEKSAALFTYVALKWLRFHNKLLISRSRVEPDDTYVDQFVHFMRVVRGMAQATIRAHRLRVIAFLKWNTSHHRSIADISADEVDVYLMSKLNAGYLPRSMASVCSALRLFFRFAEMQEWNRSKVALGIYRPRVPRYDPGPKGPVWNDVRRLLDHNFGAKPADVRAEAIMSLCSIYALRSCEVVRFKLSDFDWANEIITIQRAKSGRVQQFPIQLEVGEKLIRYLKQVRPRCKCRNLFLSLKPPYRPVDTTILWTIIASRMKALGIQSKNFGAHSLRHACATQLLRDGTSLPDIAEFLGHSDLKSVSIYAKYDVEALRKVADFSLAGIR